MDVDGDGDFLSDIGEPELVPRWPYIQYFYAYKREENAFGVGGTQFHSQASTARPRIDKTDHTIYMDNHGYETGDPVEYDLVAFGWDELEENYSESGRNAVMVDDQAPSSSAQNEMQISFDFSDEYQGQTSDFRGKILYVIKIDENRFQLSRWQGDLISDSYKVQMDYWQTFPTSYQHHLPGPGSEEGGVEIIWTKHQLRSYKGLTHVDIEPQSSVKYLPMAVFDQFPGENNDGESCGEDAMIYWERWYLNPVFDPLKFQMSADFIVDWDDPNYSRYYPDADDEDEFNADRKVTKEDVPASIEDWGDQLAHTRWVFNYPCHNFCTGDPVIYNVIPEDTDWFPKPIEELGLIGLVDGETYFVLRINNDQFQLCMTSKDARSGGPVIADNVITDWAADSLISITHKYTTANFYQDNGANSRGAMITEGCWNGFTDWFPDKGEYGLYTPSALQYSQDVDVNEEQLALSFLEKLAGSGEEKYIESNFSLKASDQGKDDARFKLEAAYNDGTLPQDLQDDYNNISVHLLVGRSNDLDCWIISKREEYGYQLTDTEIVFRTIACN